MSRHVNSGDGIDAPFHVECVHRLRFTDRALDPTNATLCEVLDQAGPRRHRLLAFVDSGVAAAWPDLRDALSAYAETHCDRIDLRGTLQVVPGGEVAKNDRVVWESACRAIDEAGICRQSFVLVIGGGAVLDAIGFAAATLHRGVRLVRMPTTTLAQADSGLGVKCGINLFGKKNLLGSFATPWAVINDWSFLSTLTDRDFLGGFSEVVKVALLKDRNLFRLAAASPAQVAAREPRTVRELVRRSAELHLRHIVDGGDPFELTASRPLDFGHWSAHKLEQMTGFEVTHGEAVAIGVALDVIYSAMMDHLPWPDAEQVLRCLSGLGFDLSHERLGDTPTLLAGLREFREHLGGELTITLLSGIGEPIEVHEMDASTVRDAVERLEGWERHSAAAS